MIKNVNKKTHVNKKILTSQQPKGSPLAASNPADMIVKSGSNSEAEIMCLKKPSNR